ncbi:DMT family transporter [Gemmobacter fulvus]|uniref:DMT family transporter n=1 Tax=Gemmobacter fulvus TaxID=2840474 RepID=UPI0027968A21|nr:DMT family transporter [Gemmobacter fulvus]MDQ1849040.1 DMT family transporter [Gemmobacter fulvus]
MRYGTGVALVVLAGILWSVQGLIIRNITEAGTWAVLVWRSVGMVPVLLGFVAWRSGGQVLARLRAVGVAGVLGGLGLVFAFAGAIFAFQTTSVAMAVFLFSASPFFAAVLGWLVLREPVRNATWAAIGLAAIGIFLMVREGFAIGAMAGNIAALLSAFGFAAFTVSLRWGKLADMMPAVALGGVFSIVTGAAMLVLTGAGTLAVPLVDIALSAGMGAVTLAGGMVLYTLGSRVIPAAELTLLSLVEVMLAPVWVWLALGETASAGTLTGGAVLMAAVAVNAGSGLRRRAVAGAVP